MANPAKRKGDAAELEAARLISQLLGVDARRALGAGRADDVGDIDGVDGWAIQIANWKDTARAALVKPPEAQQQADNASAPHAATFVRFRGGTWRIVLTPEQWASLARLTLPEQSGPSYLERILLGLDQHLPPA